jgi:hypothetical protein
MVGGHRLPQRDGQLQKWKAAVAKNHRQQRQQRGERAKDASFDVTGPGMIRRSPPPRQRDD